MRNARCAGLVSLAVTVAALLASVVVGTATQSRAATIDELVSAVVRIKTQINLDGRTVESLGRERDGSGIIIDEDGLILTTGYLMVEAYGATVTTNAGRTVPATIVGYDHETGFGLLRTIEPLKIKPLPFGKSGEAREGDPMLVVSHGGSGSVGPARIASKREFAGNWEYLLDEAIFTTPPYPNWSGAALISRDGKLIGVGSLIVGDAGGDGGGKPGNMFVPIDRLSPILGDLLADGRVSGAARPWIGVAAEDTRGQLVVGRITAGSPAELAGLQRGDVIVGVAGEAPRNLADFYRKVWAQGAAGVTVPLDVQQGGETRRIDVKSMNRLDHLRLRSTL